MFQDRSAAIGFRFGTKVLGLILGLGLLFLSFWTWSPAQTVPPEPDRNTEEAASAESSGESVRSTGMLGFLEDRQRMTMELLLDAARGYRKVVIERNAAQQELNSLLEQLDRDAVRPRELSRDRLDQLTSDVDRAQSRIDLLMKEAHRRLDDIRRLISERDSLNRRVSDMRSRPLRQQEILTGTWDVTWMPSGQSGSFYLDQSGTLVSGQYKIGSSTGSLQGTFINGKLYLQRIDSQRGRDCEIEGVLEPDGNKIRGTWQNFELVQGGIPRGQWVARRANP